MIDRSTTPFKILGKVAVGIVGDSRKFSGHPHIVCIAIFARAQLSYSSILTRVVGLGLEPKTIEAEAGKKVEAEIETEAAL